MKRRSGGVCPPRLGVTFSPVVWLVLLNAPSLIVITGIIRQRTGNIIYSKGKGRPFDTACGNKFRLAGGSAGGKLFGDNYCNSSLGSRRNRGQAELGKFDAFAQEKIEEYVAALQGRHEFGLCCGGFGLSMFSILSLALRAL